MPNKNGHLPRIVQVAILVCVSFIYWHVWHRLQLITRLKVVPEFLRTLVFARPRGDDQFADCTFSPSLDMSR